MYFFRCCVWSGRYAHGFMRGCQPPGVGRALVPRWELCCFFLVEKLVLCLLCSGCEIGFKAQELLAKELLVKSLSSRPVNTGPLEVGKKKWKIIRFCFIKKKGEKTCVCCDRLCSSGTWGLVRRRRPRRYSSSVSRASKTWFWTTMVRI